MSLREHIALSGNPPLVTFLLRENVAFRKNGFNKCFRFLLSEDFPFRVNLVQLAIRAHLALAD